MTSQDLQTISIGMLDAENEAVKYRDDDVILCNDFRQLPLDGVSRLGFNLFIICGRGRLVLDVGGWQLMEQREQSEARFDSAESRQKKTEGQLEVSAGQMAVIHSGIMMGTPLMTADFEGRALCLSDKIIQALLHQHVDTWNRAAYIDRVWTFDLEQQSATDFQGIFGLMKEKITRQDPLFLHEIVCSLLQAFLFDFCRMFIQRNTRGIENTEKTEPTEAGQPLAEQTIYKQGSVILQRFLEMVAQTPMTDRRVDHYAERLSISPKYLSSVCKHESGKSASEWIAQYAREDIRYYLTHTTLSVKEISNRLNFPNISFFGRYVKKHFGVSPTEFRNRLR